MGLSLVTAITATVVVPPGLVAADQVSTFKAQAVQIAQDLVLEQLQIGSYQQQYDVDIAKVQRDRAEIGSSEDEIQADVSRVSRDRKRLQSEAVSAYVNLDPEVNGTEALFENQKDAPTRAEYEEVASGDIALTIDALRTDEIGLRDERATLEQQEARDQATTNQVATLGNAAAQDPGPARVQAVRDHGRARRGGGPAAGGTGRGGCSSSPGGTGHGRCRSGHFAPVWAAFHHLHDGSGKRRQHVHGRPLAAPLPPMRPAG